MTDTNDWIAMLEGMYRVISASPVSATLSTVGFILFAFALLFANKAVKQKPEDMTRSSIVLLYLSFIGGVVFSALGPAVALRERLQTSPRLIPTISQAQGLDNLYRNAQVTWVVRLIAYDPMKQEELKIGHLTHLGKRDQRFTFVADYQELQGYTVDEAVRKLGGEISVGDHVSAVVFPLKTLLYPANARGLLQVLQRLANTPNDAQVKGIQTVVKNEFQSLTKDERKDLENTRRESWTWPSYGKYYGDYCEIAQKFRCSFDSSAKNLIGEISHDWHPLGFARMQSDDPCSGKQNFCEITEWEKIRPLTRAFGARVFLIENLELSKLDGHILINFHSPTTQIIPYITAVPRQQ